MSQSILDHEQIIEAVHRYALGYDQADSALLGQVFSEKAISGGKIAGTDMGWGPTEGRDEILSGLQVMRAGQSFQPRHMITNAVFHQLTGTEATATFYLVLLANEGSTSRIATAGRLEIVAIRQGGDWRISRLDVILDVAM